MSTKPPYRVNIEDVPLIEIAPAHKENTARFVAKAIYGSEASILIAERDPDSVSAGSFFTNPIVSESFARTLPTEAPRWSQQPEQPPLAVPLGAEPAPPPPVVESTVKLSAAWLIEHSGITRGFALPGSAASVSKKHTLALTNPHGTATAEEIAQLARYIQTRVMSEFGVALHPEPVFINQVL